MGEPMTKKIRVWNPAIDDLGKDDSSSPSTSPTQPLDFSKSVFPPQMPLLMQNYMHLAPLMLRMQQQQMESAMRQRFMVNLAQARMQQQVVPPPFVPAAAEAVAPNFPVPTVPQGPPHIGNPLVASALGVTPISENCCAVCGASFRLTGDLVTHMRNNHRRTRFKRKNEKPVD